ncbi:MAG TPA: AmmeMemoRadiSam system radical SAM enzyme [Desulfobacteraceae bacterium]|nr:AmmeMemoRadiSam system radical SAM enzyme [Desulfobacteraceae bacterium]HPJ67717.1 AmmeMemoRadiSam system radical SAM enzyme [Desulfobacteraceae bacterium]HPQ29705.1 AmmeMemoRadiSam system radical SAM enzyme [Desulfobacteraceae bacterium]
MKEAYLYEKLENKRVRCFLCSHKCLIKDGAKGICGVRENRSGILVSLVYDKIIASHCDPIEKKPLFHFLPGTSSYSIATAGCNFKCSFCQNSDISQLPSDYGRIMGKEMKPEQIVEEALNTRSATISYTYTEPTVYFELSLDTARYAVLKGLKNVFVSNGYMTEDCLKEIYPDLHAANIDLKAFSDEFYKQQCGGRLEPVLKTLETINKMGIWLEVTTLLIPGLNDSEEELKSIAGFLANLDPSIPWHISRFHPTYRLMNIPPTSAETIRRAREYGYEAGLKYVYTGNLPGDNGENTFCHECGEILIDRYGFYVTQNKIKNNRCPNCNAEIPGVWT